MRSPHHGTSVPASPLDNAFSSAYLSYLREQDEVLTAAEAELAGPWKIEPVPGKPGAVAVLREWEDQETAAWRLTCPLPPRFRLPPPGKKCTPPSVLYRPFMVWRVREARARWGRAALWGNPWIDTTPSLSPILRIPEFSKS